MMREESCRKWLKGCLKILQKYQWLMDLYILDFFVDDHWSLISDNWKDFIRDLSPEGLAILIDLDGEEDKKTTAKVWPLEILALKASVKAFALNRKPWSKMEVAKALGLDDVTEEWSENFGQLQNIFRKHMNPKKQHEIFRMADVANLLKKKTHTQELVDIGGGLGHLSRFLSFGRDFNVTCLEAEGQFGKRAMAMDDFLIKSTQSDDSKRPKHLTLNVDPDLKKEDFDETIDASEFGLVGLHTCGDLGPTIVRLFCQSTKVTSLQSVGCCYQQIQKSFPLSQHLKATLKAPFSYCCLEFTCHAVEAYKDRLKTTRELQKLKVHCRRAVLESILTRKRPNLRHTRLKPVKRSHEMAFSDYVNKATADIKDLDLTFDDLDNDEVRAKEGQWLRVVAFYTLKLLFAPLIETVLLLDRCMYLMENGHECVLAPIFDPRLSPRNFVILSCK